MLRIIALENCCFSDKELFPDLGSFSSIDGPSVIIISSGLHILIIFIATLSLPFIAKKPLELPPIISVEYEIKSGDTIQKILKKFKIRNNEINSVIKKYKNYGNANQLAAGNKINIIVEKDLSGEKNSIVKFAVPITKSTTIDITKDESGDIISKKIITKLYKK